jgi:hypothetical protein
MRAVSVVNDHVEQKEFAGGQSADREFGIAGAGESQSLPRTTCQPAPRHEAEDHRK